MRRGWVRVAAAGSGLAVLLYGAPAPVAAEGNAGLHLHKTVDPLQLAITPGIGLTLGVDKATAIPGDTLTYTAVVSNPTATFAMGGDINAQAVASTDANVAYYWDELEYCALDCGNGAANPNWTALATFEAGQAGYQPVTAPHLHTGMSFAASSVARSGVTYPASGDPILGTQISPSATAAWTYRSTVVLTPAQITLLGSPGQASAIRNVLHFEVTARNVAAAQPYTDPETFSNPFLSTSNPGALTNVSVTFTLPDGSTAAVGPGQVPGLASLNPGGTASAGAQFKVPVPAVRDPAETEGAYVLRLQAINGSLLTASAVASGGGFSGPVYATSPAVMTQELLPMVTIAKSGPALVNAGDTETNSLALQNAGGATATALSVVDAVPSGGAGAVSGVPPSLAAAASVSASATYPVPISQASGDLTDTASVTWKDGNGNPYGPLSSSFTTQVHNNLFGATLTLTPANAGPNTPGSTQTLTATLRDSHGNPIAGQPVTFTVTGANPGSGTGTTDAGGAASFTYTGAHQGNDQVQAAVVAPGITISSNTSVISWLNALQPVVTTAVQGNFFPNPGNSCTFDVGPGGTPAFGQTFPNIMFNPDPAIFKFPPPFIRPDSNGVVFNISTRPFTDITTDVNGNPNGQIVAQGNGFQAGTGSLINFYGLFNGTFVVNQPGDLTFRILHDDGYIFGVGGSATRVSGDRNNDPATTPFNNYGVIAAWNTSSTGSSSSGPATVHFPAAGVYPYELDYTECGAGPLFLDLMTEQFVPQTNPLSVYVGYADGLRAGGSIFPFPWNGSPNTTFEGCTGCTYDGGAIRIDNSGTTPAQIDNVTVDIPMAPGVTYCPTSTHFDIWPHNLTIPAGQILILAPEASGTSCSPPETFDTSDTSFYCGPDTGIIPLVNLTSGGVTTTFKDSTQVLNTGGKDVGVCTGNESESWQRIGGGGTAINLPVPPAATLNLTPFNVPGATQGQSITLTVAVLDGTGNPAVSLPVTLQVSGANTQSQTKPTDAGGLVTFTYTGASAGVDSVEASAFVQGLRSISNVGSVMWIPPGGTNNPLGPSITNPSPADGSIVTKPVPVDATIAPLTGHSITSWRAFYQALDPGPQVTLASGTGTPPSPLATFDPTLLPNDAYAITLEATDSGGGVQDVTTTVGVMGNLKLGRYVTTYQDLSVPVNGFQMEVRRTYDSTDKSSGDFGVGWKVDISNFRVASNRMLGAGGWIQYNKSCVLGLCFTAFKNVAPRFVTVTYPDQHTEVFDFTPQGGTNIFWSCTPQFTARGSVGTTSTLIPLDDTSCSYMGDGNIYGTNGIYSPNRFKLTTHGGMVLVLDSKLGLLSETDPNGNTLALDSTGLHASNGESITYTRDSTGRITQVTGPSGETLTYTYSASNDLATSVDANHNQTAYTYDANHDLLTTQGAQPLQKLQYDSVGRLVGITDISGNTTTISNDVAGQKQLLVDPAGRMTTVLHYDDLGDVIQTDKVADGTTVTTSATFDGAGRTLSQTDGLQHPQYMQYDQAGDMVVYTDRNGAQFHIAYNAQGQVVGVTDGAGRSLASYVYDSAGNLTDINDPDCPGCHNTYDSLGRLSSQTMAVGGGTSYSYDPNGHPNLVTDARGDRFQTTWDASGHVLSRTDPTTGTTHYTYDANGNILTQTDARQNTWSATYTVSGNIHTLSDPFLKTTTFSYDTLGRQSSAIDRNGAQVSFTYDADGRQVAQSLPGGDVTSRTYDGFGRLSQIANGSATVSFQYDADGRIVSATTTGTATDPLPTTTFDYTYDANGNRLTSAGPDGTITNTYDALGRLSGLTDPNHGAFVFGFDTGQRLTSLARPNGVNDALTYDASSDLLSRTASLNGITVASFSYTYGAGRQRASATDAGGTTTYTYDQLLRLVGASSAHGQETYQYDASSNRTSAQSPLGSFAYTYDTADRMLTDGTFDYTYDAEGNLVSKVNRTTGAGTTYSYNARHQLLDVQLPNGNVTSYQYDPLGRRVLVNANGAITKYAYDGDALRLEFNGTDTLLASYVSGVGIDSPLEMRRGANSYYYLQDGLGSVRALTDSAGSVVQTYSYDSFGNPTASGSIVNPFTYTGRELDASTGLYYYRARYYDPAAGRFLGEDPLPALNPYVYAANDPTNFSDPTGANSVELAIRFIIISAIAGALSNAITTAILECAAGCFDWRDVLVAALAGALGGAITAAATISPVGWFFGGALGGAAEFGVQDLGNQAIHHPGHIDGGEVAGSAAAGAGAGVLGGILGGGDLGITSIAGGYYRNAFGQFAEKPGIIDTAIPGLITGMLAGMLQNEHRANSVCP